MSESLRTLRRHLGSRLGMFLLETTTTTSSAANQYVIATLADSELETSYTRWLYTMPVSGTNAGEVRRVKKEGLATGTGTLTLTRAHTGVTDSGIVVELYGVLPPKRAYGQDGLLECLNAALRECWTIDTLSITGVADQYQYALSSSYPWLYEEGQIIDLYWRPSGAVRDELFPTWRFIHDVDGPQIELGCPIGTSDTLKPKVYRPLSTWIKTGSPAAWAASTTGLANDTDEALLTLDGAEIVGLAHCYETLAQLGSSAEQAQYRALADRQRAKANAWKRAHLPHETGRSAHWTSGRTVNWPPELG